MAIVEPAPFAVTTTPSMAPSSAEVTCPVSGAASTRVEWAPTSRCRIVMSGSPVSNLSDAPPCTADSCLVAKRRPAIEPAQGTLSACTGRIRHVLGEPVEDHLGDVVAVLLHHHHVTVAAQPD